MKSKIVYWIVTLVLILIIFLACTPLRADVETGQGLTDILKSLGKDLSIFEIVLIWLVVQIHREVFKPLRALLRSLQKAIDEGHFSHNGVEKELRLLRSSPSMKSSS